MIAFIIIFHFLYYLGVVLTVNLVVIFIPINGTNETIQFGECGLEYVSFHVVFNILYLVDACFLPFIIMFITTVMIIKTLASLHARLNVQKMSREIRQRKVKDVKFAINSIVLNVLYSLFQIPIVLSYLINFYNSETYIIYITASLIPYYINFSMPFISYLVSNSIFRREILKILGFKMSSVDTTTNTINRRV